jgi:hypothetical protein
MKVGLRFTEDSYTGYVYPASGYMDVGGAVVGQRSAYRVGRVYHVGPINPIEWARRCHACAADVYEAGNEPNLRVEGVWTRDSYVNFANGCRQQAPTLIIGSAGMSPSNDAQATQDGAYPEWYRATNDCNVDYANLHIYGQTLANLIDLTKELLSIVDSKRKVGISEINFGPGANVNIDRNAWARAVLRPFLFDYARYEPRIMFTLYFAYLWKADFPIATPVDAKDTAIMDVLAEAANLPTDWNIGEGYKKVREQLGWTPLENEIYHFEDNPTLKASMAVFDLGHATWDPRSNETVAIANDGSVYSDGGNKPYTSDGKLVLMGKAS